MKEIKTSKEFDEAPPLIQFIYAASSMNQPLGKSMFDMAINDYPEYFEDELEHRRKWSLVPQDIQDTYFKEISELHFPKEKQHPYAGMGMIWYIDHPKEYAEYNKFMKEGEEGLKEKEQAIHDKYLKQYGL